MSTVSTLLLDGPGLDAAARDRILGNPKVAAIAAGVRALSALAGKLPFVDDLSSQIAGALDRPLGDGLVGAWRTWSELREFADREKHPPGVLERYVLGEFRATSTYEPKLDVLVEGRKRWTIDLTIEVTLDVESCDLGIRDGRILEMRLGRVTGGGALSVEGTEVVRKESKPCELPGVLRFDPGIAIPGS